MAKNLLINSLRILTRMTYEEDRATDLCNTFKCDQIKSIGAIVYELRARTDIQTDGLLSGSEGDNV